MKVYAYVPLHYGKEYLPYAVESIYPYVDVIGIYYTQSPSYGHTTEKRCPETEDELKAVLEPFKDKVVWKNVWAAHEGQHRQQAEVMAKAEGYDVLLAVDSDEVWDGEALAGALQFVAEHDNRQYRVPFVHFWKDFAHVCKDPAQPHRLTKLTGLDNDDAYIPLSKPVYHFGYAISDELMRYKWEIHGHKAELRDGWFEHIWQSDRTEDVHPTCERGFWNVEAFDSTELPEIMRNHPKYP